jgi:hypothetical protein
MGSSVRTRPSFLLLRCECKFCYCCLLLRLRMPVLHDCRVIFTENVKTKKVCGSITLVSNGSVVVEL